MNNMNAQFGSNSTRTIFRDFDANARIDELSLDEKRKPPTSPLPTLFCPSFRQGFCHLYR